MVSQNWSDFREIKVVMDDMRGRRPFETRYENRMQQFAALARFRKMVNGEKSKYCETEKPGLEPLQIKKLILPNVLFRNINTLVFGER